MLKADMPGLELTSEDWRCGVLVLSLIVEKSRRQKHSFFLSSFLGTCGSLLGAGNIFPVA